MQVVALVKLMMDTGALIQREGVEVPVVVSVALQIGLMLKELDMAVMVAKVLQQRQNQEETAAVNWASQAVAQQPKVAARHQLQMEKSNSRLTPFYRHPTRRVT